MSSGLPVMVSDVEGFGLWVQMLGWRFRGCQDEAAVPIVL